MSEKVKLYGTPTCAMVAPVRGVLERAQMPFEYVNILQDEEARQRVLEINDGYASVPTIVFADGSTLTEPSLAILKRKLRQLGYSGRAPTWLEVIQENLLMVLMSLGMILFGIIDGGNWVFLALGTLLLLGTVINGRIKG